MAITESLLPIVGTIELPAICAEETKRCFTGERWRHRDSDFDGWLPEGQPATAPCLASVVAPSREMTAREWAAAALGLPASTSIEALAVGLKERNHTLTPGQAEETVEATERGSNTGLRIDGFGNFFFMVNGDGSVSVGCVCRGGGRWFAHLHPLTDPYRRTSGRRLVLRDFTKS